MCTPARLDQAGVNALTEQAKAFIQDLLLKELPPVIQYPYKIATITQLDGHFYSCGIRELKASAEHGASDPLQEFCQGALDNLGRMFSAMYLTPNTQLTMSVIVVKKQPVTLSLRVLETQFNANSHISSHSVVEPTEHSLVQQTLKDRCGDTPETAPFFEALSGFFSIKAVKA